MNDVVLVGEIDPDAELDRLASHYRSAGGSGIRLLNRLGGSAESLLEQLLRMSDMLLISPSEILSSFSSVTLTSMPLFSLGTAIEWRCLLSGVRLLLGFVALDADSLLFA